MSSSAATGAECTHRRRATACNIVFGDYGTVTWSGTQLATASATAQGAGGIDDLTTGVGDDLIFGGTAGDTRPLRGAGDDNIVFGDRGRRDLHRRPRPTNLTNVRPADSGRRQ